MGTFLISPMRLDEPYPLHFIMDVMFPGLLQRRYVKMGQNENKPCKHLQINPFKNKNMMQYCLRVQMPLVPSCNCSQKRFFGVFEFFIQQIC